MRALVPRQLVFFLFFVAGNVRGYRLLRNCGGLRLRYWVRVDGRA